MIVPRHLCFEHID